MTLEPRTASVVDGSVRTTLTRTEILEAFRDCLPYLRETLEELEEREENRIVRLKLCKEKVRRQFKKQENIQFWDQVLEQVYFKPDTSLKRIKQWVRWMEQDDTGFESIEKARSVDIIEFAKKYSEVKQHGARGKTLCPFHEDKTPSLILYEKDNGYHCFSCGAHGDIITFTMQVKNISFKEAVKHLSSLA